VIKSIGIGHSPGDEGESLRRDRHGIPVGIPYLIATGEKPEPIRGDVTEGVSPRKTISSLETCEICGQWRKRVAEALETGSRVAIRMALFGANYWLMTQLSQPTYGLLAERTEQVTELQREIAQTELQLGEWYQYQLGCETRLAKKIVQDYRSGALGLSWSEVTYTVLPRLHMLSTYDLIVSKPERVLLAKQLANLDWRPM
jgi:hypothetical protein